MIEHEVKSTSASVIGQEITDRRITHRPHQCESPAKQTLARRTCTITSRVSASSCSGSTTNPTSTWFSST
jgi:hypothetical protein